MSRRPATRFNLGIDRDYRVPDGAVHRPGPDRVYYATAALVIEIVSPGDERWSKLPFYAAHDVEEVLIVDPATHSVDWLAGAERRRVSADRAQRLDRPRRERSGRADRLAADRVGT
jgi:Uma2 family endonuclease